MAISPRYRLWGAMEQAVSSGGIQRPSGPASSLDRALALQPATEEEAQAYLPYLPRTHRPSVGAGRCERREQDAGARWEGTES